MKLSIPYGKKQVRLADIAAFQRAAAQVSDNRAIRIGRIVLLAVGAVCLGVGIWQFSTHGSGGLAFAGVLVGALLLLLSLFYYQYLASQVRLRLPKRVTRMDFDFADDGLHVANQLEHTVHPYKAFHAIGESSGCYFLFLTPKQGYYIPKRAVPAAARAEFGPMLQKKFKKKLTYFNV